jgi:hypothetical protein
MKKDRTEDVKALKLCLEMWKWIQANPGKGKLSWPGWDGGGNASRGYYNRKYIRHQCFLCEQFRPNLSGKEDVTCNRCPLRMEGHKCYHSVKLDEHGNRIREYPPTAWEKWLFSPSYPLPQIIIDVCNKYIARWDK